MFYIDSASQPALKKGGRLRPMLHAAFAALIMYFEERELAGEMTVVNERLITVIREVRAAPTLKGLHC